MPSTESKDRPTGADCVCFNLRKAARSITHVYDAALRPSGLRATQYTVLNVVRALAPAAVTKIADAAVIDRTTLTRSLTLLERDGLLRMVPSSDGRERLYALTAGGERALDRARPFWEETQARVIAALGAQRLDRLFDDLGRLVETGRSAKARNR
jgi:DNA-binding MarR family transcriptional regulator